MAVDKTQISPKDRAKHVYEMMKELQARRTAVEVQTGRVQYYWPVSL